MHDNKTKHERLADRIGTILIRLYEGQVLQVDELAAEFKTCIKTIQRDFERLGKLPMEVDTKQKKYSLSKTQNKPTRFSYQDFVKFAEQSGVLGLYPGLNRQTLGKILDQKDHVFTTKGVSFEDAFTLKYHFEILEDAIEHKKHISFFYKNKEKKVKPYRIINHRGTWYLAAVYYDELKAYRLSHILSFKQEQPTQYFEHDDAILEQLAKENSIWFGKDKVEVIIRVADEVSFYFRQKDIFHDQKIVSDDGEGLLISVKAVSSKQVLPLLRYWIPHLKVIHPEHYQVELEQSLKDYLSKMIPEVSI